MTIYVITDENGRLLRYANHPYHIGDGEIQVENTGVTPDTMRDWRLENGALVYDPIPAINDGQEAEKTDIEKLKSRTAANEAAIAGIMDLVLGGMM